MANYTVRIELHGASEDQYDDLHARMENEGFVRWIKSNEHKYRLPTAEYNLTNSALTVGQVRDKAKAVADAVKPTPKPWILVTESNGRSWSGLEVWRDD